MHLNSYSICHSIFVIVPRSDSKTAWSYIALIALYNRRANRQSLANNLACDEDFASAFM